MEFKRKIAKIPPHFLRPRAVKFSGVFAKSYKNLTACMYRKSVALVT